MREGGQARRGRARWAAEELQDSGHHQLLASEYGIKRSPKFEATFSFPFTLQNLHIRLHTSLPPFRSHESSQYTVLFMRAGHPLGGGNEGRTAGRIDTARAHK